MALTMSQIGLSPADQQRLKAIMGILLTNQGMEHRWSMGAPGESQLVIIAADSDEGLAFAAENAGTDGKLLAVLAGESDTVPGSCVRLPWPLRVEDMLRVLKKAENLAEASSPAETSARPAPPVQGDNSADHIMRLAVMLRDANEASGDAVWYIKGFGNRSLYVVPGHRSFYYGDSLATLRNLDPKAHLEFVPISQEQLPGRQLQKPIVMLQWLVGLLTGPLGPLPWIRQDSVLRLRRFPEFQMLHHTPQHRRMAAALSRPRKGLDSLVQLTELELADVTGFINAVSLCGYLMTMDVKSGVPKVDVSQVSKKRTLFKSFRKALGIA